LLHEATAKAVVLAHPVELPRKPLCGSTTQEFDCSLFASVFLLSRASHKGFLPKEMQCKKKRGGLLQRAMPPITTEGSRIRPIASTYNVMITWHGFTPFLFVFGSSTDGRPSNNQR